MNNLLKLTLNLTLILILTMGLDYVYLSTKLVDYSRTVINIQGRPPAGKSLGFLAYVSMAYAIYMARDSKQAMLYGFLTYSIFNATNYFMFYDWTLDVAVVDTIWGSVLFFLAKTV